MTGYDYPRPQLTRDRWVSLDGAWEMNGEEIIVPYSPQSKCSGYEKDPGDTLLYKHSFRLPETFDQPVVLLHFGAVDQIAEVFLNGEKAGEHHGGYLPFSFDVTALVRRDGENELIVKATDTLSADLPYGKQRKKRGGMWYTPVSGIWNSVWLENVPARYLTGLKLTPDLAGVNVELFWNQPEASCEARVRVCTDEAQQQWESHTFQENKFRINISDPIHWTPDRPFLYRMELTAGEDRVGSYFALRTVGIEEIDGVNRVCLNGEPVFLHGLLDQGYFADGIYTPGDWKEYERDILRAKDLGFNMLRKHIKIEPEQFYEACDRLGMLVIQDMVNNGVYSFFYDTFLPNFIFWMKSDKKHPEIDIHRKRIFIGHMIETMEKLHNHPCIVAYTIFNEGWGQFEADRLYGIAKETDDTRLIDSTSGWFAQHLSDFDSKHIYFHSIPLRPKKRPMLLSECGGFSLEVKEHLFSHIQSIFGYGKCHDEEELTDAILHMYEVMVLPAIQSGLCGCVYTQLSDVEDEINGIYTYDRQVCKVQKNRLRALAKKIYYTLELAVTGKRD